MKIKIINNPNIYKTGGEIHIKESHKGLFTQKAEKAGMGVQEFASHVLANKDNYSHETIKQAVFAQNAAKWNAYGGNLFNEGGTILGGYHTNGADWQAPGGFHIIGSGGTHEENKNEGVLQGTDPQGVPNLVEENEVVYNDYVFSNRLTVPKRRKGKDKEISDLAWEEKMLRPYEGKTYAEAAQKAYKNVQERPNDPIAKRGLETVLGILAGSQEKERAKKEHQDAAKEITEMSGQEFAQAKEAEEQQQAMEQAALEQAMQQQMQQVSDQQLQDPQMQEQQMQEQQTQEPSPEEIAMMQQQQAMQQAGQAEVSALGGNIHAYGGNFYDNGGQLDLQRYQQIFQQIAQYAAANKDKQPELFNAVSQVKTPQDMLQFVSNFLAAQEAEAQQRLNPQPVAQAPVEEEIVQNPEGHQFAQGGPMSDNNNDEQPTNNESKISQPEQSNEVKKPKILTEKQLDKARRHLNRYYRKKGIDPSKLKGVARVRYEKDLETLYNGMSTEDNYDFTKDSKLAINSKELQNKPKKSIVTAYVNNALYDNMIERGAKAVDVTKDNKVSWNGVQGLTIVPNSTTKGFYSNTNNLNANNGVYDYTNEGSEYKSNAFTSEEELQDYYKNAITNRFKKIKGNKYNDKKLKSYYLTAEELRSWVRDLQKSEEPKDRELANILKANWGDKNTSWDENADWKLSKNGEDGTIKESQSYLDIPEVKENKSQTDALPGIAHVPYLAAVKIPSTANRYFYIDKNTKDKIFIKKPQDQSFEIADKPLEVKEGDINFNDYEVKGINKRRELYKTNDGRVLDITNMNRDENDQFKQLDHAVMSDDPNSLGTGITGESIWFSNIGGSNGVDYQIPSEWPWGVGLGLQAGSTLYNAIAPIDYSNSDAVISAAKESSNVQPVGFRPIGDYLTYRPLDRNYEGNKVRSAMAAQRRALANLSGGNRGTAAAGILASDYNMINQLGDIDRKAAESNREQEAKVAEFNRGTNQFNSEGFLKADMANQDARSRASQANLEGLIKGYAMRQAAEDAKANAFNAGISGMAQNLFGLYQQNQNNANIRYSIDTKSVGNTDYDWKRHSNDNSQRSKGGKLRTRRKRGLTF